MKQKINPNKKIYFICEIETKSRKDLIIELERVLNQLKDGYTSGLNWNSNIPL